ncbi:hypothetical protein FIBSPDRAFT_902888 [Athelia psychrophila]|uniref:Uncharacterized protein n=1 Tax=Athelia psychrophila TaxID=1759441 RepID=A0A167WNT0_9AGAM|nr:hypothetical protein FIBSPDRAFT_902888 [Fibularhizoctonia sp. CBS 109695]
MLWGTRGERTDRKNSLSHLKWERGNCDRKRIPRRPELVSIIRPRSSPALRRRPPSYARPLVPTPPACQSTAQGSAARSPAHGPLLRQPHARSPARVSPTPIGLPAPAALVNAQRACPPCAPCPLRARSPVSNALAHVHRVRQRPACSPTLSALAHSHRARARSHRVRSRPRPPRALSPTVPRALSPTSNVRAHAPHSPTPTRVQRSPTSAVLRPPRSPTTFALAHVHRARPRPPRSPASTTVLTHVRARQCPPRSP